MKYFVFSDIHGNLEALETVLGRLDEEYPDHVPVCLGDIVGYGPNPKECIQIIRERNILCLAGNHDHAVIGKMDISYFNPYAKEAVLWTRSVLDSDDIEFLKELPLMEIRDNITFVHATPCEPQSWNYLFTLYDAQMNFNCFETPVCFVGHSHQAMFIIQKESRECWVHPHPILSIRNGWKYIVNVGSVGQPRDGNPKASFLIFDAENELMEIKRIEYDVETTQEKMKVYRLPDYLIARLKQGR